jgi:hypothetical protein
MKNKLINLLTFVPKGKPSFCVRFAPGLFGKETVKNKEKKNSLRH